MKIVGNINPNDPLARLIPEQQEQRQDVNDDDDDDLRSLNPAR